MTTVHDATAWRDLIDQLNPRQIERLTVFERRVTTLSAEVHASALLAGARAHVENNRVLGVIA